MVEFAGRQETDRRVAGLRSILMLLGCSSVKIQRCSAQVPSKIVELYECLLP